MKKQTKKLPAFKKALTYLSAALLSTSSGVALAKPSENFTQVYTFGDSFAGGSTGWSPYFTNQLGFQVTPTGLLGEIPTSFSPGQNNFAIGGSGSSTTLQTLKNYIASGNKFSANGLMVYDPLSSELTQYDDSSVAAGRFGLAGDFYQDFNDLIAAGTITSMDDLQNQVLDNSLAINSNNFPLLFEHLQSTQSNAQQFVEISVANGAPYVILNNHFNEGLRQDNLTTTLEALGLDKAKELVGVLSKAKGNAQIQGALSVNGANIVLVDTYSLIDELVANTDKYLTADEQSLGSDLNDGVNYKLFRGAHPTQPVNKIKSQLVSSIVNSPTRIALLREIPLTLGMKSGRRALTFAQHFTSTSQLKNNVGAGDADNNFSVEISGDFTRTHTGNFSNRQLGFKDADTWDGAITLNYKPMDSLAVGMTLDYADTKTKFTNNYGKAKTREVALSLHGVYSLEQLTSQPIFVYADAGMGKLKYKTHRYTPQGIATIGNTGSPSGNHYFGTIGTGYRLDVHENMNLTPFAAMRIQSVSMKAFSEKENNHTKMSFSSPKRQSVQGEVGLTVAGKFDAMNNVALTPSLTVSYLHEWKDPLKKQVRGRHTDMPRDFAVPAYHIEESGMQIQGNVTAAFCNQYTVGLNASTKPTGRVKNYSVGLNAGINF